MFAGLHSLGSWAGWLAAAGKWLGMTWHGPWASTVAPHQIIAKTTSSRAQFQAEFLICYLRNWKLPEIVNCKCCKLLQLSLGPLDSFSAHLCHIPRRNEVLEAGHGFAPSFRTYWSSGRLCPPANNLC